MFKNIFSKKPKVMTETLEEEILTNEATESTEVVNNEELLKFPEIEFSESEPASESITPPAPDPDYLFNSPEIVGWFSTVEQEVIFDALLMFYTLDQSILDVGCGRADLFGFISKMFQLQDGMQSVLQYKGIDINPNMVKIAQDKFPGVNVEAADILKFETEDTYNWVIASGLFNLKTEDNMPQFTVDCIDAMYEKSNFAVGFNLMTDVPDDLADADREQLMIYKASEWLEYLTNRYRKVICRTDYMLGDVTFFIFK
jgi:SAM-dependent methyltransferase